MKIGDNQLKSSQYKKRLKIKLTAANNVFEQWRWVRIGYFFIFAQRHCSNTNVANHADTPADGSPQIIFSHLPLTRTKKQNDG
jgi:hypothetical protein